MTEITWLYWNPATPNTLMSTMGNWLYYDTTTNKWLSADGVITVNDNFKIANTNIVISSYSTQTPTLVDPLYYFNKIYIGYVIDTDNEQNPYNYPPVKETIYPETYLIASEWSLEAGSFADLDPNNNALLYIEDCTEDVELFRTNKYNSTLKGIYFDGITVFCNDLYLNGPVDGAVESAESKNFVCFNTFYIDENAIAVKPFSIHLLRDDDKLIQSESVVNNSLRFVERCGQSLAIKSYCLSGMKLYLNNSNVKINDLLLGFDETHMFPVEIYFDIHLRTDLKLVNVKPINYVNDELLKINYAKYNYIIGRSGEAITSFTYNFENEFTYSTNTNNFKILCNDVKNHIDGYFELIVHSPDGDVRYKIKRGIVNKNLNFIPETPRYYSMPTFRGRSKNTFVSVDSASINFSVLVKTEDDGLRSIYNKLSDGAYFDYKVTLIDEGFIFSGFINSRGLSRRELNRENTLYSITLIEGF